VIGLGEGKERETDRLSWGVGKGGGRSNGLINFGLFGEKGPTFGKKRASGPS